MIFISSIKKVALLKTQEVTTESIYLFDVYDVVTLFTMYNSNKCYLFLQ